MLSMTKDDLQGFAPAVVTPFNSTGEIMEDAFRELVTWLISIGATAVCVAGDNGESWALSAGERARLTAIAREAAQGSVHIMTGCSAPTLETCLDYARAAQEAGAEALLLMPPTTVLKGSRREILRRYEAVGKAVPLPIVVYNSPRRVGYSLGLDDLDAILDVAPVVGIKESNRDFFHLTHLLARFHSRLSVMVGPSHYILPGLALGASGFIATGPELLGPTAGKLTSLGRSAPGPDYVEAHGKLTILYETLMRLGTWPSAFKAALNYVGQPAGATRDPVLPLDEESLAQLHRVLDDLGLAPR